MLDKKGEELHVGDKVKVMTYFKGYVLELQHGDIEMAYVDVVKKVRAGYRTKWMGFYCSEEIKKVDW